VPPRKTGSLESGLEIRSPGHFGLKCRRANHLVLNQLRCGQRILKKGLQNKGLGNYLHYIVLNIYPIKVSPMSIIKLGLREQSIPDKNPFASQGVHQTGSGPQGAECAKVRRTGVEVCRDEHQGEARHPSCQRSSTPARSIGDRSNRCDAMLEGCRMDPSGSNVVPRLNALAPRYAGNIAWLLYWDMVGPRTAWLEFDFREASIAMGDRHSLADSMVAIGDHIRVPDLSWNRDRNVGGKQIYPKHGRKR